MNRRNPPLRARLAAYLYEHGHITPAQYRTVFGAERLAPRIEELRKFAGMNIETRTVEDFEGKKYTRYVLLSGQPGRRLGFPEAQPFA